MAHHIPTDLTTEDLDSVRDIKGMAKVAEIMGYRGVCDQLQFNNGSYASSLFEFFDDNPGAVEALTDWIRDNYDVQDAEGEEGDEGDGEDD